MAAACGRNSERNATPAAKPDFTVTADQIAASGAGSVWEALRLTVRMFSYRETQYGRPLRITRRGRSSIMLSDMPRVVIDDVPVSSLDLLAEMPAADVASIQVVSGIDGTTYQGTGTSEGLIRIRTQRGGAEIP
jgi:hypothetical protein